MTYFTTFPSPIGELIASTDGNYLTGLHIAGDRYFKNVPHNWLRDGSLAIFGQVEQELEEYFAGSRVAFDVAVRADGTDFQKQVWAAISNIPAGSRVTYSDIATAVGKPAAVRAVGTAVGRNPVCLIVPCHRVVTSSGGMGGYVAGIDKKRWLLELEAGRLVRV